MDLTKPHVAARFCQARRKPECSVVMITAEHDSECWRLTCSGCLTLDTTVASRDAAIETGLNHRYNHANCPVGFCIDP